MSSPASAARSGSATIAREIDGQGWPPSLKFNEHIEAEWADRVRAGLQNGPRGDRIQA